MYIYVFQNITSRKKYLGYTDGDINKYLGSGKYWKSHCIKHGGLTETNIERIWFDEFDYDSGKEFLSKFEEDNPEYWKSEEWANLVPETLEVSPFKGNMKTIFELNGNPFAGGEIQRKAHAEGKHNYDKSETVRKGWKNRSKEVAVEKMKEGYYAWMESNREEFLENQKIKAEKSRLVTCKKIVYNNELYLGWRELHEKTGISKHMFLKYNMGEIQ